MIERRWYALHVMTGREEEIAASIRRCEIANTAVPARILKERRRGKLLEVRRVLIPGYVFVEWAASVSSYYQMTAIPGVIRFVAMTNSSPTAIPEDQMAPILALTYRGNPVGISQVYKEGGITRIRSGPLKDLEAYIIRIDARNGRATIRIPLLNMDHTIQLGIEMLEPTNTPEPAQADSSPRMAMGDQG